MSAKRPDDQLALNQRPELLRLQSADSRPPGRQLTTPLRLSERHQELDKESEPNRRRAEIGRGMSECHRSPDVDPCDRLLTLSQAAALIPGRQRSRVHASTLARWISRGVRAPDGRRIRLRAVRLASRWQTTQAWIDEFAAALTPNFTDADEPVRSERQRHRASHLAGKRLAEMGA